MARDELFGEDIQPQDRVMTPEGFPGTVTEVWDTGEGHLNCVVTLDDGQGGGNYDDGELTPLEGNSRAASVEAGFFHTAETDYPELGNILSERLPMRAEIPANEYHGGRVLASVHTGMSAEDWRVGKDFLARVSPDTFNVLDDNAQRHAVEEMLQGYYTQGVDPNEMPFARMYDHETGVMRHAVISILQAAVIKREALYLPLTGQQTDPMQEQASDDEGYKAGLADGKKAVTRNPGSTEQNYVASYQLGWARGVELAPPRVPEWEHTSPDDLGPFVSAKKNVPIQSEAGLWDFIKGNQNPSDTFQPGHNWDGNGNGNWCRYKNNSRCMYPTEMNKEATKVAGYPVWIPVDRGFCPRATWKLQSECPMGMAGQNVPNGFLNAAVPWEDGGQRVPPGWGVD